MSSDELSDLQYRVKDLEDKVVALHNRMVVAGVDDLPETGVDELPETIKRIDGELDEINQSVGKLQSDLSDLEERVEKIEKRLGI
jgi:predicted nuclease with TOPRIM domain